MPVLRPGGPKNFPGDKEAARPAGAGAPGRRDSLEEAFEKAEKAKTPLEKHRHVAGIQAVR